MEEASEEAASGDDTRGVRTEPTYEDILSENSDLKQQLVNQIAIFEQYLRVAVLQHQAKVRKAAILAEQGIAPEQYDPVVWALNNIDEQTDNTRTTVSPDKVKTRKEAGLI